MDLPYETFILSLNMKGPFCCQVEPIPRINYAASA